MRPKRLSTCHVCGGGYVAGRYSEHNCKENDVFTIETGPNDEKLGHDCARYIDGEVECGVCGWHAWPTSAGFGDEWEVDYIPEQNETTERNF